MSYPVSAWNVDIFYGLFFFSAVPLHLSHKTQSRIHTKTSHRVLGCKCKKVMTLKPTKRGIMSKVERPPPPFSSPRQAKEMKCTKVKCYKRGGIYQRQKKKEIGRKKETPLPKRTPSERPQSLIRKPKKTNKQKKFRNQGTN